MTFFVPTRDRSVFYAPTAKATWVTSEAGAERVHFNVGSDDTPEDLERKAREAVEKWKASE